MMPGGYIQSGSQYEGMEVHSTKSIASYTIARLFSIGALVIYLVGAIYVALNVRKDAVKGFYFIFFAIGGLLCNKFGLVAMIVTFIKGTCAVLQHALTLAIATCLIACCAFTMYSFVLFMIKLYMDHLRRHNSIR